MGLVALRQITKANYPNTHLQEDVARQLEKMIQSRHLEEINDVDEGFFISTLAITVKRDRFVQTALDSRKLNDCYF